MKDIFNMFILVCPLCLFLLNVGCAEPRIVSACFFDSTEIVERRIPFILSGESGVRGVRRLWDGCKASDKCLCYEVKYSGDINEYASWIKDRLRKSSVRSFRLKLKENDRLEVHFNWGFEEF